MLCVQSLASRLLLSAWCARGVNDSCDLGQICVYTNSLVDEGIE